MEEDKSLKNILDDDFGRIILKIRKEKNLTQKELADLINVSDRTISKWENGQSVPDLICIKNICKSLGISPSSLVLDKKSNKEKIKSFSSKIISFITIKKVINFIILCLLIVLFIFYLNNRNSITIYKLNMLNKDIYMRDGYVINSKYKNIIVINDLKLNRDDDYDNITVNLYTIVNGDRLLIYTKDSLDDIFIDEYINYNDDISKDIANNISKELILTIVVEKDNNITTYDGNINVNERYQNGVVEKMNNIEAEVDNNSINNKLKELGYEYDKSSNSYYKNIDKYKLSIILDSKLIVIDSLTNDIKSIYNYDSQSIDYIEYDNKKNKTIYLRYTLNDNKKTCKVGKCENNYELIDKILSIYDEIKDIL